ncbi:unnamed protein product, partial [Prorocentrum cordatum]
MGDRYVEVLAWSDRLAKTCQRRAADACSQECAPDACRPEGDCNPDRVLQECRDHVRAQGSQLLLSMLGVALSAPSRSYLRGANLSLKQFLARHPEFHFEGPKGGEKVLWAGAGANLDTGLDACFHGTMMADPLLMTADPLFQWALAAVMMDRQPASPEPTGSPTGSPSSIWATPPSVWASPAFGGTPPLLAGPGMSLPGDAAQTRPAADISAAFGAGVGWPYWTAPWEHEPFAAWPPGAGPGEGGDCTTSQEQGHGEKPREGRGDGSAARSHLHLHPATHPFAHGAPAGFGLDTKAAAKGDEGAVVAAVRLRGLPFSVTVQDVLAFFAQHDVADRIADRPDATQLLRKANGRPSGQAVVQMRSRQDAEVARDSLNDKYMDTRYIEVFVYGGDDGDHNNGDAVSCATAAGQLPDGEPHGAIGITTPRMPWEVLVGQSRAPQQTDLEATRDRCGGKERPSAEGAGRAEPAEWSALFRFLERGQQADAEGPGIGGAFLLGGGPRSPTGGGA